MKIHLFVFTAFVTLISISSCQQDTEDTAVNGETPDNIYAKKIISLDTAYTSGQDTLRISTFTYDADKRLTGISMLEFEQGTHNIFSTATQTYYYSGTARVPFKIATLGMESGTEIKDTLYLFYNSGNVVNRDSSVIYLNGSLLGKSASVFTANGTNRYKIIRNSYSGPGSIMTTDSVNSMAVFSGNNLVSASDSVYNKFGGTYTITQVNRYTNLFDTRKNAFKKTVLPYPTAAGREGMDTANYTAAVSQNNILSQSRFNWDLIAGASTQTITRSYEYNSDGYPVIRRYPGTGGSKRKDLFYYRKL